MNKETQYIVSEQQKQLWNIELQISDVLLNVCKDFGFKIWACYGTLLGAARHKGFIPWDDDMDFVMMRKDYDVLFRLISLGKIKMPDLYEWDTSNIRVIKLRRKDTTMMSPDKTYNKNRSYGIWVDIFALDVAPDDVNLELHRYEALKTRIKKHYNATQYFYSLYPSLRYKIGHFYCRISVIIIGKNNYRKRIEDCLRADSGKYSGKNLWGFMIWSTINYKIKIKDIRIYKKEWFEKTIMLPFEDRVLPCPIGWENILTAQYGNWRTPVMGSSQHEGSYVNLFKPYSKYIDEVLSKIPWWKRYWYKH